MNWCMTGGADSFVLSETILECDYDKNVTNLYEAIERGAWDSILMFLRTQKWSFMTLSKESLSPESQVRTWVTRFDPNGKIRWSQLPLHAAIIFCAPKNVVKALIELYPLSVRCSDDQQMLPLHLAFRVGAKDSIMNLLIKCFPDALVMKNQHGKIPYAIVSGDTRKDFNESVHSIVRYITQKVTASQQKSLQHKTGDLEDEMAILENDNHNLENELSEAKIELVEYKERCRMLEIMLANTRSTLILDTTTNNDSNVISREQLGSALDPKDTEATVCQDTNDASAMICRNLDSSAHHGEPIPFTDTITRNDSIVIREKSELANVLDPKDTEATSFRSTSSLAISIVNLNSSIHHHEPGISSQTITHDDNSSVNSRRRSTLANTPDLKQGEKTMYQNMDASVISSVNLNLIQHSEEPDICWNEIKETISKGTDIALKFQRKETIDNSKPSFIMRESEEKVIGVVQKEKETRVDKESTTRQKDSHPRKNSLNKNRYVNLTDRTLKMLEGEKSQTI